MLNLLFTFRNNRIDVELNRRLSRTKISKLFDINRRGFNTTNAISTIRNYVLIKVYHDRQMFLIVIIVINHQWEPGLNDSYEAAINSSSSLSKVEKFNYLRSYLEGEALHTVSGLSLTNDNYEKALKLLKDRFGNPQSLVIKGQST